MADTNRETERVCPKCQSCDVMPLLGLLPGGPPYAASSADRPPVAQCVENEGEAGENEWRCKDCGHEWDEAGEKAQGE